MSTLRNWAAVSALGMMVAPAAAATITFDSLDHGRIVTNQYLDSDNLSVYAINPRTRIDWAAAFDTESGTHGSPNLRRPWRKGNLAPDTSLGNILIVAAHNDDMDADGILDRHHLRADRGTLVFEFSSSISSFGFDVVNLSRGQAKRSRVDFYDGGSLVGSIIFSDLTGADSNVYDPTVEFGPRSANRIAPIQAGLFGAGAFDEIHLVLAGAGGVDNLVAATVPEPPVLALVALGAVGLSWSSRRSRSL